VGFSRSSLHPSFGQVSSKCKISHFPMDNVNGGCKVPLKCTITRVAGICGADGNCARRQRGTDAPTRWGEVCIDVEGFGVRTSGRIDRANLARGISRGYISFLERSHRSPSSVRSVRLRILTSRKASLRVCGVRMSHLPVIGTRRLSRPVFSRGFTIYSSCCRF
jgi:hypothetical protein